MSALRAWCNAGALFSTIMPSLRDFRFADRPPFRSFLPSCCRSIVLSCRRASRAVVLSSTARHATAYLYSVLVFSFSSFLPFPSSHLPSCNRAFVLSFFRASRALLPSCQSCPRAVVLFSTARHATIKSYGFPNILRYFFSFYKCFSIIPIYSFITGLDISVTRWI